MRCFFEKKEIHVFHAKTSSFINQQKKKMKRETNFSNWTWLKKTFFW